MIKSRDGKIIVTNEKQNELLKKLYGSVSGRALLKVLTVPALSDLVGDFMSSPMSKPLIKRFIEANNIDTSQFIMSGINSYNDFFTRKVKNGARPVDMRPEVLISPCDSKLSAYKISEHSLFKIKGSLYSITDLLKSRRLAEKYKNGLCLIFRLEVDDYHRYCYPDSGTKSGNRFINGELHTVNPIVLEHYNIYKRNCREYTILHTDNFGDIVQVEVGALLVGKIANHHGVHKFSRGEEKGMFLFGGSTIVMLIEENRAQIDSDILENSNAGYETIVRLGEHIGVKYQHTP